MYKSYIGSIGIVFSESDLRPNYGHTGDITFLIDKNTLKVKAQYLKVSRQWRQVTVGSGTDGSGIDLTELEEAVANNSSSIETLSGQLLEIKQLSDNTSDIEGVD